MFVVRFMSLITGEQIIENVTFKRQTPSLFYLKHYHIPIVSKIAS